MSVDTSVKTIMTREVQTVTPETEVPEVARLLWEHKISGVPVVEGRRVIGMITEYDLISQETEFNAPLVIPFLDAYFKVPGTGDREQLRRILATTARQLMSRPVRTVRPDATVQDVATLMYEERINAVPVVDEADELVGIVSRADIVRLMVAEEARHREAPTAPID